MISRVLFCGDCVAVVSKKESSLRCPCTNHLNTQTSKPEAVHFVKNNYFLSDKSSTCVINVLNEFLLLCLKLNAFH